METRADMPVIDIDSGEEEEETGLVLRRPRGPPREFRRCHFRVKGQMQDSPPEVAEGTGKAPWGSRPASALAAIAEEIGVEDGDVELHTGPNLRDSHFESNEA